MKYYFYLTIILIIVFIIVNNNPLRYVESSKTGIKYLVINDSNKENSANLLENVILNMYNFRDYLKKNKNDLPKEMKKYINQLIKNFKKSKTTIRENANEDGLTSYSVNKGEEIVFCLKSKKNNKLHNINLLMYVAIHELAHVACPETGHTPLFNKIFKFFLEIAEKINLYKKVDYSKIPTEYCGMVVTSNILND